MSEKAVKWFRAAGMRALKTVALARRAAYGEAIYKELFEGGGGNHEGKDYCD